MVPHRRSRRLRWGKSSPIRPPTPGGRALSAHDLPDTPAVRQKIADVQARTLARLGLDAHRVAVWEDGFRTAAEKDRCFEWWYFDARLDDGSALIVVFSSKPQTQPAGPLAPSVLVLYRGADGTKLRRDQQHSPEDFAASTRSCDVRIGPNTAVGDLDTYAVHVEVDDLVADLELRREAPSWRPGSGVAYFDGSDKSYVGWVVPVPHGTLTGTVSVLGQQRTVTGAAYHDHIWGDHALAANLNHWYRGRAQVDGFTVVYLQMTTKAVLPLGSLNLPMFYLAKGDQLLTDDLLPLRLQTIGDVSGPRGHTYPTELLWTWESEADSATLRVTDPQLIAALDLRPGKGVRRPLRYAIQHPMCYAFTADLELQVDFGDVQATARGATIFEKMMFR